MQKLKLSSFAKQQYKENVRSFDEAVVAAAENKGSFCPYFDSEKTEELYVVRNMNYAKHVIRSAQEHGLAEFTVTTGLPVSDCSLVRLDPSDNKIYQGSCEILQMPVRLSETDVIVDSFDYSSDSMFFSKEGQEKYLAYRQEQIEQSLSIIDVIKTSERGSLGVDFEC